MNRKTRARNIALEDISSKSHWDRTFYPRKNTLIQKAAGLEMCSGAQVRYSLKVVGIIFAIKIMVNRFWKLLYNFTNKFILIEVN